MKQLLPDLKTLATNPDSPDRFKDLMRQIFSDPSFVFIEVSTIMELFRRTYPGSEYCDHSTRRRLRLLLNNLVKEHSLPVYYALNIRVRDQGTGKEHWRSIWRRKFETGTVWNNSLDYLK